MFLFVLFICLFILFLKIGISDHCSIEALDSAVATSNQIRQKFSLEKQLNIIKTINQKTLVRCIDALSTTKATSSDDQMMAGVAFAGMCTRLNIAELFPKEFLAAKMMINNNILAHVIKMRAARTSIPAIWRDYADAYKQVVPPDAMEILVAAGDEKKPICIPKKWRRSSVAARWA